MTKVTWDNVALIAPATAAALGIEHESVIRVLLTDEGGGREAVLPVYVMPGQAPFSLGIALGHGRTHAGHVGGLLAEDVAPIGADTYALRGTVALYIEGGGRILPTGARYPLASVQDHWAIDGVGQASIQRRLTDLVRTTTTREYAEPDFAYEPHGPPLESLFGTHDELTAGTPNHRWGMVTDLSSCIGCGACVVACQAENNIPIVGKEQVRRSREMHWLRIDRYFRGDPDDPEIAHQPLTCQHCENAPCEQVCPVGATIHSDEGLNDMVYNRCIGTRYCMNNCPYKVRRFNYFAYHGTEGGPNENLKDERNEIRKLLFNPEVTVRSRGVMEKCTFCVQRIEAAKIAANNANGGKGRPLADGEVVTACMQACPTGAIVFGDLGDPESQVSRLADPGRFRRGYALLAELHASPRNTYLARVRNPNPELG
jgi:molybdopterin-containing oxidoreductase family iron-sulfur binding subunit